MGEESQRWYRLRNVAPMHEAYGLQHRNCRLLGMQYLRKRIKWKEKRA